MDFFVVKIFYVRGLVSTGAVGASAPMIFQVVGASKTNVCGFLLGFHINKGFFGANISSFGCNDMDLETKL